MTSFFDDRNQELQYKGDDFATTKQVLSVRDFTLKGDYSVNFRVKSTSFNRAFVNFYGQKQYNPNVNETNVSLVQDGNKISRGKLYVMGDDGNELELIYISGNSNWFKKLDFNCREIRTSKWNVQWNTYEIDNVKNRTYGIIFPFIDFCFHGERAYDQRDIGGWYKTSISKQEEGFYSDDSFFTDLYPCAYLHTIVQELGRHAQIKINDNDLRSDAYYFQIILTPPDANFTDPRTGTKLRTFTRATYSLFQQKDAGPVIRLEAICPNIKASELIKYVLFVTGSWCYFDDNNSELVIKKFKNIDYANVSDWSAYVQSYNIETKDLVQYNYFKNKSANLDEDITSYNDNNTNQWGDYTLETDKNNETNKTVYTSPFIAVKDRTSTTKMKWASPYVPFVTFEKSDIIITYTSVSVSAGVGLDFNLAAPIDLPVDGIYYVDSGLNYTYVYIEDDNGLYNGYFVCNNPSSDPTPSQIRIRTIFLGTSTGKIYFLKHKFNSNCQAALLRTTNAAVNISSVSVQPSVTVYRTDLATTTTLTTLPHAYYFKPRYGYSALDDIKVGLSIGAVNDSDYKDAPISEVSLGHMDTIISNPTIQVNLKLPISEFNKVERLPVVRIETNDLSGFFYVNKIEGYTDSAKSCKAYLIQIR